MFAGNFSKTNYFEAGDCWKFFINNTANSHLLKVNNRNNGKNVKYVQG